MDSTVPPLLPSTADPTGPERRIPVGDPSRELVFRPVQKSLSKAYFWSMMEMNLAQCLLIWLGMQPHWPDWRLTLCQAGLLGSAVLILYGTAKWTRLFHAIDWTGPFEAIQSNLETMRDLRRRQLGWMALLVPLLLASGTLLLIQHTTDTEDEPWTSVFAALEPWPPVLFLAVIVATVLMWRVAQRQFQGGWAIHHLERQLVDGGSIELLAQALDDLSQLETNPTPRPNGLDSGDSTVRSPSITAEIGSTLEETAHRSSSPETRERHVAVLDTERFRESILQPIQSKRKQTVVWTLIEMVCAVGVLLFCLGCWGRWPDPRMTLCLAGGIATCLAYLVFHTVWLRSAFRLDWNGPLETIQSSLERHWTMRIRHLRWSPMIWLLVGFGLTFPITQMTSDSLLGKYESVFELNLFWRMAWMAVVYLIPIWFVTMPYERPELLKSARVMRFVDGGALAAFKTAQREIERWECLAAQESATPRS